MSGETLSNAYNAPIAIGYVTLFFLLNGKVPSGLGKVEELTSLSLLF